SSDHRPHPLPPLSLHDALPISATNRSLTTEIREGRFREDLFYRLAAAVLQLPPLRDRQGDVSLLIDRLLSQVNEESAAEPGYQRSEEHTSELQSLRHLVCRLLL